MGLRAVGGILWVMGKREAHVQSRLTRTLKGSGWDGSFAIELKAGSGDRISHSQIEDHQLYALLLAGGRIGGRGLVHKISDSAIGYKPFDCFYMRGVDAYVGLWFGSDADRVYLVDVDKVVERVMGDDGERIRGSITLEWARGHVDKVVDLEK